MAAGEQQNEDQRDGSPEVLGVECRLEGVECELQDDKGNEDSSNTDSEPSIVEGTDNTEVAVDAAANPLRYNFGRNITLTTISGGNWKLGIIMGVRLGKLVSERVFCVLGLRIRSSRWREEVQHRRRRYTQLYNSPISE